MLLPYEDPVDFVVEIDRRICEHHKRDPWDAAWPGCACSTSYSRRRATPEERAANIKAREEEQERRRKHIEAYDRGERT